MDYKVRYFIEADQETAASALLDIEEKDIHREMDEATVIVDEENYVKLKAAEYAGIIEIGEVEIIKDDGTMEESRTVSITPEIRDMLASDLAVEPGEIRKVEYLEPSEDDEHFVLSIEFFTRPPKWMEVDLNSKLAHAILD